MAEKAPENTKFWVLVLRDEGDEEIARRLQDDLRDIYCHSAYWRPGSIDTEKNFRDLMLARAVLVEVDAVALPWNEQLFKQSMGYRHKK